LNYARQRPARRGDGLLQGLNKREKKIISHRFGFDGGAQEDAPKNRQKIGASPRERIRQLKISPLEITRMLSQRRVHEASGPSLKSIHSLDFGQRFRPQIYDPPRKHYE